MALLNRLVLGFMAHLIVPCWMYQWVIPMRGEVIIDKSPTKSSSLSAMSRSLISLANQIGCIDPWHFF